MMKNRVLAGLVGALALSGCGLYQADRLPASMPLHAAKAIAVDGTFVHAPSGYEFPVEVAPFARVALMQYDTAGLDVSAGYNGGSEGCPVALTIYVYPTPRMTYVGAAPDAVSAMDERWLTAGYQMSKREIVQAHPDAILISEDSKVRDGIPGKKAVYSTDGNASALFLFVIDHKWYLKYRTTYPEKCSDQARYYLDEFFSAWRGRVPAQAAH